MKKFDIQSLRSNKILILLFYYSISIFVFSIIYFFLPINYFYHGTILYEKSLSHEINNFRIMIDKELRNEIIPIIPENYEFGGIIISNIDFSDYPEKVEITYSINLHNNIEKCSILFHEKFSFSPTTYLRTDKETQFYGCEGISYYNAIKESVNKFNDYIPWFEIKNSLCVSKETFDEILNIGAAYKGFPKKITGHYIRMLYLSVCVGTTMTFGDILPIHTVSRIVIILQNFVTLIFLGLVINEISERLRKKILEDRKLN